MNNNSRVLSDRQMRWLSRGIEDKKKNSGSGWRNHIYIYIWTHTHIHTYMDTTDRQTDRILTPLPAPVHLDFVLISLTLSTNYSSVPHAEFFLSPVRKLWLIKPRWGETGLCCRPLTDARRLTASVPKHFCTCFYYYNYFFCCCFY